MVVGVRSGTSLTYMCTQTYNIHDLYLSRMIKMISTTIMNSNNTHIIATAITIAIMGKSSDSAKVIKALPIIHIPPLS